MRIEFGQRLSDTFRKGRIVKYVSGPNVAASGRIGVVVRIERNMVVVDFGGAIGEYGCSPPFLHAPTAAERAGFNRAKNLEG